MSPFEGATTAPILDDQNGPSSINLVAATICLIWYIIVVIVCTIGYVQIFRFYSRPPLNFFSPNDAAAGPTVTVIRPVKGIEPYLYECLASTFHQEYLTVKLHIRFCVSSRDDPAFPVLEQLVKDFGGKYNVRILVEEEDEYLLSAKGKQEVGPNPKIRNMSRAYREADRNHGGVVWIIDCNVWVGSYTLYKMIGSLGRHKFVHQLPLTVDTSDRPESSNLWSSIGTRMDEMFMSTAHPKFYLAINTVAVAPCTLGKSTMFHTHHLDALTNGKGLDYFSHNICEDQLIGDLLWKNQVPEEKQGMKWGKHALCHGVTAIQPLPNFSVADYWKRRIRWLRVRKFTVTLATWVEPGTESFFCSVYGAFAISTLPWSHTYLGIPQTWTAFGLIWLLSVSIWCAMDWTLFRKLQSGASIQKEDHYEVPAWVKAPHWSEKQPFSEWLLAWLGREALALPIWVWAFYGGTQVEWRGKKFWVGMDMRVHEIVDEGEANSKERAMNGNGHIGLVNGKARRD